MHMIRKQHSFMVILITLLVVTGACAQNYGRFSIDPQVANDFRTGTIQPDLRYYYQGRDTMPYAIIGIDRTYEVPSKYWIAFDPDPEQLKKMSGNIYQDVRDYTYGATIMAPDGTVVGIWYSNVDQKSVTVDQENHTVQILFPNPENNDRPG